MCKHEEKNCPACNIRFECKPGDIAHCQCYDVVLTADERVFIEEHYSDCLCRSCLQNLIPNPILNLCLKDLTGLVREFSP